MKLANHGSRRPATRLVMLAAACAAACVVHAGCRPRTAITTDGQLPPPSLAGAIVDGRYKAPDGAFTVIGPHAADSYEFQNMRIDDGASSDDSVKLSYVIFGPGPTDPAGYHVVLATSLRGGGDPRPIEERARAITAAHMEQYDRVFAGRGEEIVFVPVGSTSRPTIYAVYRYQFDDAGVPDAFYAVFTITQHSSHRLVNVMAEKLTLANPWYPGVDTLVAREWERFNRFAESVTIAD